MKIQSYHLNIKTYCYSTAQTSKLENQSNNRHVISLPINNAKWSSIEISYNFKQRFQNEVK